MPSDKGQSILALLVIYYKKVLCVRINLYDWCKENNIKLITEWDDEKNLKSMYEYTYKSGQYAYWICSTCGHDWSTKICNRTNGSGCPKCADIQSGKRTIRRQLQANGSLKDSGLSYVNEWDYDKNEIDISETAISSNTKVWWKCSICSMEWMASPNSRYRGTGCPSCNASVPNQKKILLHIQRDGSFGDVYPEFVKYWDSKLNSKTCYEYTSNSTYMAHWCCPECGYKWERTLTNMAKSKGCPHCVENQTISSIQKKTKDYLLKRYAYELRHEKTCTILPKNPRTNYPMPYDNEVVIDNDQRLIIEVHGEQHYQITAFIIMDARKRHVTPEEELKYLQWRDEYKKQYALSKGYYYMALPYWTFDDDTYKSLIDTKIQEILSFSTQN